MLYPIPSEMPDSSDDLLELLAAAAKYDMDTIQSSIRAVIRRKKLFSSVCAGPFRVYAIAYRKKLIPEMVMAARHTLGHPLTFESLGDALQSFEGGALRDLADFRLRSIGNFSSNLKSFSSILKEPSKIWAGCPTANAGNNLFRLPAWLESLHSGLIQAGRFTKTIPTSTQIRDKYMKALQSHVKEKDCNFCTKVHTLKGEAYCKKLGDIATQAWNVPAPTLEERPGTPTQVQNL